MTKNREDSSQEILDLLVGFDQVSLLVLVTGSIYFVVNRSNPADCSFNDLPPGYCYSGKSVYICCLEQFRLMAARLIRPDRSPSEADQHAMKQVAEELIRAYG